MLTRRLLFSAPVQQCLLHRFGKNLQNLSTTKRLNVSIRRGYVSAPGSGDGSSSDGPRDSGSGSRIRMNFSEECEHAINKQINLELYASYVYFQMVSVSHFVRSISIFSREGFFLSLSRYPKDRISLQRERGRERERKILCLLDPCLKILMYNIYLCTYIAPLPSPGDKNKII